MAGFTRTITLGLDYSGFSGSVSQCNQQMKLLEAEFNNANATMDQNASMSERVAVKIEYMSQQLELQKAKVEAAKNKYEELMAAHADSSKIDAARTAFLNESTTLANMQQNFDLAGMSLDQLMGVFAAAVATIGAVTSAFLECANAAAEYADEVLTASSQTGVDPEMVQTWEYSAELIDVSADTMEAAASKLKKSMATASSGTGDAAAAFDKLGVKITDSKGELRDVESVMYETFDALSQMENETEKDTTAMTIFGKGADQLAGAIDGGSEAYNEFNRQAQEMGAIMSQEDLQASGQLSDAMETLHQKTLAVQNTIGAALAPALSAIASALAAIPTPILAVVAGATGLAVAIAAAGVAVIALTTALPLLSAAAVSSAAAMLPLVAELGEFLVIAALVTAAAAAIAYAVGAIGDSIASAGGLSNWLEQIGQAALQAAQDFLNWAGVGDLIEDWCNNVAEAFNSLAQAIQNFWDSLSGSFNATSNVGNASFNVGHNAGGTDNWRGGLTMVGEEGPELVNLPAGSKVYNNSETNSMMGNTYNISINADISRLKTVNDVVNAVSGLAASAGGRR